MKFEFSTAGTILFGEGVAHEALARLAEGDRRIFLITGRQPERIGGWISDLTSRDILYESYPVTGEPTVAALREAVSRARSFGAGQVVGFGGGSVIDMAKAVAAMLTNDGAVEEYLEVVGAGRPLRHPSLYCTVFPTTAGTGAEVTRNAVLCAEEQGVKISMRSQYLMPDLAVVDPVLTYSMPSRMTASTGMDALVQCVEAWLTRRRNPVTDTFCRRGIGLAMEALPRAVRDGEDRAARHDMALAATLSGLALANAGLGAVHGFAGTLGGRYGLAHGEVCAALLPSVLRINVRALRSRAPEDDALERLTELARLLNRNPDAQAEDAASAASALIETLSLPSLRELDIPRDDIPDLVTQVAKASSMKGNPVTLTREELVEILRSV